MDVGKNQILKEKLINPHIRGVFCFWDDGQIWYMRRELKFFAGVAIGIGIGAATGNIGIGIGIGIAFGAAFAQTKNEQKRIDPDSSEEEQPHICG